MIYTVYIEKGEDFGYVAHCPAVPGCHNQGETLEEAIEISKMPSEAASRLWGRTCGHDSGISVDDFVNLLS